VFAAEELDKIDALWSDNKHAGKVDAGKVNPEQRDSTIDWLMPKPEIEWLYTALDDAVYQVNKHFHLELTTIENLQLTEYDGGRYCSHADCTYGKYTDHHRKLSMSLQLSKPEDYEGGELWLYPHNLTPVTMPRMRGMATFFRSEIVHEVRPVTKGVRRSLVMWVAGPELR
jgi:PKHD-type hydroxylase